MDIRWIDVVATVYWWRGKSCGAQGCSLARNKIETGNCQPRLTEHRLTVLRTESLRQPMMKQILGGFHDPFDQAQTPSHSDGRVRRV